MTLADNFVAICGIVFEQTYDPGIVTFNECRGVFKTPLYVIAWKIDDSAWRIKTANQDFISPNDPDARPGIFSFTDESYSWSWGMQPFSDREEAMALRDRIIRLTGEFGITLESVDVIVSRQD